MIVTSVSIIEKNDGPESESWGDFWRELESKHGTARYHVRGDAMGVAILEAGMQSGKTSVMIGVDLGDCSAVIETSAAMFDAIASGVRGAAERFEGTDERDAQLVEALGTAEEQRGYAAILDTARRELQRAAESRGKRLTDAALDQGAVMFLYRAVVSTAARLNVRTPKGVTDA